LTSIFSGRLPPWRARHLHEIPPQSDQGCQMLDFQTKNPNVGKFWSVL
jgi:hypothetical protein